MDRRAFVRMAGGGVSAGTLTEAVVAAHASVGQPRQSVKPGTGSRKALMKVGTQLGDSNEILRVLAGFGVNHICGRLPSERLDDNWSVEGTSSTRVLDLPRRAEF